MDLQSLGRILLVMGLLLVAIGAVLWFVGRFIIPGNLPGNIQIEGQGFTCFIPIASMLIISIVLTIVLNIIVRIINRS